MNTAQIIIMLTQAIRDPVFAALYGLFTAILSLPGIDFLTLLRGIWAVL